VAIAVLYLTHGKQMFYDTPECVHVLMTVKCDLSGDTKSEKCAKLVKNY
jgi:hypothetical protein